MVSYLSYRGPLLAAILMTLGGVGQFALPALADPAKSNKGAKQPTIQPRAADRHDPATRQSVNVPQQVGAGSNKRVAVESQTGVPSGQVPLKSRRHRKAGKKLRPPAILRPRPDVTYHGILERPQRYNPGLDRRTGQAPNPHTRALLHEHFQELDKNHDGMIDPVERALGRLDIEHDLTNRRRE